MHMATHASRYGLGLGVLAVPCEFSKYPVVLTLNCRRSIPNPFQCSSSVRFVVSEFCNHLDAFYWSFFFSGFCVFVLVFQPGFVAFVASVASVARVGVWLLWLYHALPCFTMLYHALPIYQPI